MGHVVTKVRLEHPRAYGMGTGMAQLRGVAEAQTALEMIGAPAKASLRGVGEATAVSPSYPNEPAGATQMAGVIGTKGWPFDWSNVVAKNPPETISQPWEGIYFQVSPECSGPYFCAAVDPNKADTVSDQSGPVNDTIVGRYKYNSSNAPSPFGEALIKPASFNVLKVPANVKKQYLSMWVKFSSNWFLPATEIKLVNIWGSEARRALIPEIRAAGAARAGYEGAGHTEAPYYLEVRNTYVGNDGKISQVGGYDTSYFDNNPRMYNGIWYQVEYVWDWVTKLCQLYLDGVLVADGTSSYWADANTEFSIDGTLGGQCTGCPELPAEMYWYQDDLYMSYTVV